MDTNKRQALRLARELRESFRARGEFTQSDYRDELGRSLLHLRDRAYEGFVDGIAEAVDRDRDPPGVDGARQRLLFDLEGEYRLGDERRIAKRLAHLQHADAAIAIDEQNLTAVLEASRRKHKELSRLRPYWGPGVTKEQAVAAYRRDHPDV